VDVYEVELAPPVVKELRRFPQADRRRLLDRMDALGADPRPSGCEKLTEVPDAFRVRVGSYRVVYRVDDPARVVEVIRIGQRGSVYRRRSSWGERSR
jgi:mRNA interferase RelE/StbE